MPAHKNGDARTDERKRGLARENVSKLGQRLREISDKALASGTSTLSSAQIHRMISEIRGKSF